MIYRPVIQTHSDASHNIISLSLLVPSDSSVNTPPILFLLANAANTLNNFLSVISTFHKYPSMMMDDVYM